MKGAVIGDIVGSVYEFHNIKAKEFPLLGDKNCFTDDTILTCAAADWVLNGGEAMDALLKWGHKYKHISFEDGKVKAFSGGFLHWLDNEDKSPYNAHTNGCVMRLSPIPMFYRDTETAIKKAIEFTNVTHNHPQSINAVSAYVETYHLCQKGEKIAEVKRYISGKYNYDLNRSIDEIRQTYKTYFSCNKSVPEAMIAALDANDYEDSLRNAISIGGDSDTLACMAGGIAEARFGANATEAIYTKVKPLLDREMIVLIDRLYQKQR